MSDPAYPERGERWRLPSEILAGQTFPEATLTVEEIAPGAREEVRGTIEYPPPLNDPLNPYRRRYGASLASFEATWRRRGELLLPEGD